MNQEEQLEELVEEKAAAPPEEFKFITLGPEITFQTKQVPLPASLYIGRDITLLAAVASSVPDTVITLSVRLLLLNGALSDSVYQLRPTGDRTMNFWSLPLPDSFLISVTESVSPGVPPGAMWTKTTLVSGGGGGSSYPQTLTSGYLVSRSAQTWPYPRFQNPCEGPGRLRLILGTDPPAGTIITETVPAGAQWKLLAVRCWLITSVTAGDRYVSLALAIDWGGDYWLHVPSVATQPASTTYYYNWAIGLTPYVSTSGNNVGAALPDQAILSAGMQLRVVAGGFLAADNFSAPRYLVEEWVLP